MYVRPCGSEQKKFRYSWWGYANTVQVVLATNSQNKAKHGEAFSAPTVRAKDTAEYKWIRNVPHDFHTPLIRRLMCQSVDAMENRMHKYSLESSVWRLLKESEHNYFRGTRYPEKKALLELDSHPLKFGYLSRTKTLIRLQPIYPSHAG